MIRLSQLRVNLNDAKRPPVELAARALKLRPEEIVSARIFKKSVDARDKRDVHFSFTLDVEVRRVPAHLPRNAQLLPEAEPVQPMPRLRPGAHRPIVVGMGPAGLFAALHLVQAGLMPLVIERGRDVDERAKDVERFWSGGAFDPASNVQFGEGGAGTFSDGKLNSGIKDPRCREVLETFVRMGAPEEILYQAKPHIGTDHLRAVVRNMRLEILRLGGEVRFETKLTGLRFEGGKLVGAEIDGAIEPADELVLAIGHSARDTFEMLNSAGVTMEQKPFSIGARIEHRQKLVNRSQYGAAAEHPALGAADYKLSCHLPDGRAAYTFCMCPGGQVVAAASESGGVVVNGMSMFKRDSGIAHRALVVNVSPEDFGTDPLAGVEFQRKYERLAFALGGGNYHAPAQNLASFLAQSTPDLTSMVQGSYRPGLRACALDKVLPGYVTDTLRQGIVSFGKKLTGYDDGGALLTGVETRTSAPVRIERDKLKYTSVTHDLLYPCGEGAGYAGGIMSAALDGYHVARAIMSRFAPIR